MNNYKVELYTIIEWVSNRRKQIPLDGNLNDELVLNSLLKSANENIFEPNEVDADPPRKIYILGNEKRYPNALALLILMKGPIELAGLLEYHKKKFEQNALISSASFDKLLTTYVKESLFLNGQLLGFQPEEINTRWEGIEFFINRPANSGADNIYFNFNSNQKEKIVKALSVYVKDDERYLLNKFLSESVMEQRITFNVQANVIAELFLRFYSNNIIIDASKRNTAIWLSDRITTKSNNRHTPYISPSHQALLNVLKKRKDKLPSISKRILVEILP